MKVDAVFEGGGVKGIGLVGGVAVTEEEGYVFENVAGTSAGAIVAALIAAGYSAQELKEILLALDYRKFKDEGLLDKIPILGKVASLGLEKGIFEGDYFEDWMRELLVAKRKRTFKDLVIPQYKNDPKYRYCLRVIAADISRERMLILPQDIEDYGENPDDLDIARAVRMSMSIPFFFEPVQLKHKDTGEVSYIVDGGILSNYPVFLFDSPGIPEWPTFGYLLVEDPDYERHPIRHKIYGPLTLFAAMFSTMMDAHDKQYVREADFVRTIPIPTLGVRATDFDLAKATARKLYQSGVKAAKEFFRTWDFEKYKAEYREKEAVGRRKKLLAELNPEKAW